MKVLLQVRIGYAFGDELIDELRNEGIGVFYAGNYLLTEGPPEIYIKILTPERIKELKKQKIEVKFERKRKRKN